MSKKIKSTLYFDPEIDQIISERCAIMGRNRSVEVERLIRKALKYEAEMNNLALLMAEQ